MQLDHIFFFVASQEVAERTVAQLGLIETYRRNHPGQGTSNICCCFDNAFVEFLWITDQSEAQQPHVVRMGLIERYQAESLGNCPFGIAWRGEATGATPIMWSYAPSYLPAGMTIAVAADSDDHRLPLVFQSPGTSSPLDWPKEKRGTMQQSKGLHAILQVTLAVPFALTDNALLRWLSNQGIMTIAASSDDSYAVALNVGDAQGKSVLEMSIPVR